MGVPAAGDTRFVISVRFPIILRGIDQSDLLKRTATSAIRAYLISEYNVAKRVHQRVDYPFHQSAAVQQDGLNIRQ